MRITFSSFALVGLMAVGCDQPVERSFTLPTAPADRPVPPAPPVTSVPVPTPPPLPPVHKPLPEDFRPVEVGQTVTTVVGTNPPECTDPRNPPGWPCQYFRLVAPADGRLLVIRHEHVAVLYSNG